MFGKFLRGLGLRRTAGRPVAVTQPVAEFPPLRGESDLAVVGDIHGMIRPFDQLLARIEAEVPEAGVVCVGDLIDRGDDSAGVLRLAFERRDRMIVLLGNHEEMMLGFLDDPVAEAGRWLRNGGLQTLASFAIQPPASAAGPSEVEAVRDRLRAAIGPAIEGWLRSLPRFYLNGNLVVSHAGADPWLPISQQSDRNLTWGHPDFGRRRRTDGLWVAHGHVIVDQPKAAGGVISVDTGAYAGGGLTCAVICAETVRFLTEAA